MRPRDRSGCLPIRATLRCGSRSDLSLTRNPVAEGIRRVLSHHGHLVAVQAHEEGVIEVLNYDNPLVAKVAQEVGDEGLDEPRVLVPTKRHAEEGVGAVARRNLDGPLRSRRQPDAVVTAGDVELGPPHRPLPMWATAVLAWVRPVVRPYTYVLLRRLLAREHGRGIPSGGALLAPVGTAVGLEVPEGGGLRPV